MDDFQKEQHQIARHYDTQLWAIPVVFFAVVAFEFQAVKKDPFVSYWNVLTFVVAAILSWVLLLLFNKVHFQQLRMTRNLKDQGQEQNELASFYSIAKDGAKDGRKDDLINVVSEADDLRKKGFEISCLQEWLAKQTVTNWVKIAMWLSIFGNLGLASHTFWKLLFFVSPLIFLEKIWKLFF